MADLENKSYFCEKCKRTMSADQFYASNNLDKYPNEGKLKQCKKCITMHVDNWNPETYLWILQECDVPYIPEEWHKLMSSYARDKSKVTGMTILGRYLSKMKLNQWKKYRWEDNEFLQEQADAKTRETMERQGYKQSEIDTVLQEGRFVIPEGELAEPVYADSEPEGVQEDYFAQHSTAPQIEIDLNLTDEDLTYLCLKWGKTYRPEEWVKLEQMYEEMMGSYDIQTAGHIDTLKLVCKTSLKANQLLDIGDVDGAQKMVKMYDGLMKSGKFTAQQNKAESGEYVDSVSELVAICETDGFIPRYYVDEPKDKVDRVLQDLQNYTHSLVTEEMNLGNLIENAVKQIELDKEKEALGDAEAADDEDLLDNLLFSDEAESVIKDEDFETFYNYEEELAALDDQYLSSLSEGG